MSSIEMIITKRSDYMDLMSDLTRKIQENYISTITISVQNITSFFINSL